MNGDKGRIPTIETERARREEVVARLREIAREVQAQNQDLTADEAEEIAKEISRAAIEQLVEKGKVTLASEHIGATSVQVLDGSERC